ncbi:hypothetical protein [Actinocorallia sp. A-T 12471]|uniref:hypothetical protein n=1 Tax=Actinocorallia sp. A-T 12471 TaxID=3089813 RepID=UPI0029D05D5C|nr:hypothetical protein [Actinocorallia sp. A-T 12471]MDX6744314.1 hypothetical protein [Actinocorallia sp. A-T 12471]
MHPGRRPLRRLGTASVLVSTGALLVLSATPAAAAEDECVKGVDPQTTIDNITCQWNNNVEHIKGELDKMQGKDKPKDKPKDLTTGKNEAPKPKPKPKNTKPVAPPAPAGAPAAPSSSRIPAPQTYTDPLPEVASATLPEPKVADAPTTLALPETHLVSPVAAMTPAHSPSTRALWTAAAVSAAAAALMAHFTLLGTHLRRQTP